MTGLWLETHWLVSSLFTCAMTLYCGQCRLSVATVHCPIVWSFRVQSKCNSLPLVRNPSMRHRCTRYTVRALLITYYMMRLCSATTPLHRHPPPLSAFVALDVTAALLTLPTQNGRSENAKRKFVMGHSLVLTLPHPFTGLSHTQPPSSLHSTGTTLFTEPRPAV